MSRTKLLTLAVVAVATAMALVSSGTASATSTSLCKAKETDKDGKTVCADGNTYPAGTGIHAELEENTTMVIQTPLGMVVCSKSTIAATTEKKTEEPLGASIAEFTVSSCNNSFKITVKVGTLDIELVDLPEWTHDGELELTNTEVVISRLGLTCTYRAGLTGLLTGGAMATIDLAGELEFVSGSAFCGEQKAPYTAFYTVKKPEPLWVST